MKIFDPNLIAVEFPEIKNNDRYKSTSELKNKNVFSKNFTMKYNNSDIKQQLTPDIGTMSRNNGI